MLVYCLPIVFGYLADKYTGRWRMIVWGVYICGIAHIIMLASGTPSLLQAGHAGAPFIISLYVLSIGAGKTLISL
jgi:dipeptide/tripeptide permease